MKHAKRGKIETLFLLFFLLCTSNVCAQNFSIEGNIKNMFTGMPIANANILLFGTQIGTVSNEAGDFSIDNLKIGTYRLVISYVGYEKLITDEFPITNSDYFMDVYLEPKNALIPEVVIAPNPFRKRAESPLSMTKIEFRDIEKNAGANRDISRVIQSYAGVASPISFRNDIIVRGGGPSENKFYIDGIEIPQINHFSTQGASGGPVSILNADLIQSVDFYSGAFPSTRSSGISSIMDIQLRNATSKKPSFKFVVGASEFALTSEAIINDKFSYEASVRRSYLQLLFKFIGLPFLPNYTDGQFKVNYQINPRHRISLIGIGAMGRMKLNTDMKNPSESNLYILGFLPVIEQNTYTLGVKYLYRGNKMQNRFYLKTSFFDNRNIKYLNNIETIENLILDFKAKEYNHQYRSEHQINLPVGKLEFGAELTYDFYKNSTIQSLYTDELIREDYKTDLHLIRYGAFASWSYQWGDLQGALGARVDANNYTNHMKNPLNQISPRASMSWNFAPNFFWNAQCGLYNQIPALTIMGFKNDDGVYANRINSLRYIQSLQYATGVNYTPNKTLNINVEGFMKHYDKYPVSVVDSVPLASKGGDYGIWGNEAIRSTGKGRAYGVEVSTKLINVWDRLTANMAYTWVRSEFKDPKDPKKYIPSAWDNRNLFTATANYRLPKNWDIGAKLRIAGGAPFTPYDLEKSSLVEAWDAKGGLYLDYDRYNSLRGDAFYQLDVRVDKAFQIKKFYLSVYLDIQNATNSKYKRPDVYIRTGKILNPEAPLSQQRYELKPITVEEGTVLPTVGITFEF